LHGIDPEEGHRTQDEGEDGELEARAAGEAAGGDRSPIVELADDGGERGPADAVDRPVPALLSSGLVLAASSPRPMMRAAPSSCSQRCELSFPVLATTS